MMTVQFNGGVFTEGRPAGTHQAPQYKALNPEQWGKLWDTDPKLINVTENMQSCIKSLLTFHRKVQISIFSASTGQKPTVVQEFEDQDAAEKWCREQLCEHITPCFLTKLGFEGIGTRLGSRLT